MVTRPPYICMGCVHLDRGGYQLLRPTCKAFPKGIPNLILDGFDDHHDPFPGDNGIQFQQQLGRQEETDTYYRWIMNEEGIEWLRLAQEAKDQEGLI